MKMRNMQHPRKTQKSRSKTAKRAPAEVAPFKSFRHLVVLVCKAVFGISFAAAFAFHCLYLTSSLDVALDDSMTFWTTICSFTSCQLINLFSLGYLVVQNFVKCQVGNALQLYTWQANSYIHASSLPSKFSRPKGQGRDPIYPMKRLLIPLVLLLRGNNLHDIPSL